MTKKIYIVANRDPRSDFEFSRDLVNLYGYEPYHDAGLVILADSLEEANRIMIERKVWLTGTLTEIEPNKSGLLLECDGAC